MKIIECPRDAMQGLADFVPTPAKIAYLNKLLEVGFDTLDFGSFVSPKAIPQMRDTVEVLSGLHLSHTDTKLLAIVANVRGAKAAAAYDEIQYLGYPLSLSATFQKRNTNRTLTVAFEDLAEIQEICQQEDKTLVVYLSMGFGNPFGDPYTLEAVADYVGRLDQLEVEIISLADTVGAADPRMISNLFQSLIPAFPHIEWGAHLHATYSSASEKVDAAFQAGCRRMDVALHGLGGCPMAGDELVGNIATEHLVHYMDSHQIAHTLSKEKLREAMAMASEVLVKA